MNLPLVEDSVLLNDIQRTLTLLWGRGKQGVSPLFTVPSTQPCSIMRSDLLHIHSQQYRAGLKTDGIRVYMLCSFYVVDGKEVEYVVLIDRAFKVYRVVGARAPADNFEGTLLDGELTLQDEQVKYTVFDAVAVNGYNTKQLQHSQRVHKASDVLARIHTPALRIDVKVWYSVQDGVRRYKEVMESQTEQIDGIILVPEHSALVSGTQRDLFKWKPSHLHTIDLVYNGHHLMAMMFDTLVPFLSDVTWENEECAPRDCVAEYQFQQKQGKWHVTYKLTRDDKVRPNDVRVARLTLQNIEEAVQLDDLVLEAQ